MTKPILLALVLTLAGSAAAQRRSDQARLSFGVGFGYNGATGGYTLIVQ